MLTHHEAFASFPHILYFCLFLVSSPRTCSLKFLVNTQNLWTPSATAFSLSQILLFNITGISFEIFLIPLLKRLKKKTPWEKLCNSRKNSQHLRYPVTVKSQIPDVGFWVSKAVCARQGGWQQDRESIRDLLTSLPGQLRVQGRQLRRPLGNWWAPLALSAEQATILQTLDAWTIFYPDAVNRCPPITNHLRKDKQEYAFREDHLFTCLFAVWICWMRNIRIFWSLTFFSPFS